jgi:hypothetical protein
MTKCRYALHYLPRWKFAEKTVQLITTLQVALLK